MAKGARVSHRFPVSRPRRALAGLWLSADPIGEDGGLNLYGYVENDPINAVDPDGLIRRFIARKIAGEITKALVDINAKCKRISHNKHHQNSESPEPKNAQELYDNSIPDSNGNGVRWAKGADGTIHRFSGPVNGECHWNGSNAGKDPIKPQNIPNEIKKLALDEIRWKFLRQVSGGGNTS